MKVLVCFSTYHEEITMAVVDMSGDEYEYLSNAHDYMIKDLSEKDEEAYKAADIISWAFYPGDDYSECPDYALEYFGKWYDMIDMENQDMSKVDKLISTGIY